MGAPIFSCVNEERVKMKGHGNFGKTNYTMKVIKDCVLQCFTLQFKGMYIFSKNIYEQFYFLQMIKH